MAVASSGFQATSVIHVDSITDQDTSSPQMARARLHAVSPALIVQVLPSSGRSLASATHTVWAGCWPLARRWRSSCTASNHWVMRVGDTGCWRLFTRWACPWLTAPAFAVAIGVGEYEAPPKVVFGVTSPLPGWERVIANKAGCRTVNVFPVGDSTEADAGVVTVGTDADSVGWAVIGALIAGLSPAGSTAEIVVLAWGFDGRDADDPLGADGLVDAPLDPDDELDDPLGRDGAGVVAGCDGFGLCGVPVGGCAGSCGEVDADP